MIPLIEREVVTNKKWVKTEDVTDVFAIAGSAPGAIAINSATFIGYRIAGIKGAIAALLGVLLPTFTIVIILSMTFLYVQDNRYVDAAFQGIRPAIVALIAYAGYKIGLTSIFDKTTFVTAIASILLLTFLPIHPALIIVIGIVAGIMIVKVKAAMGFTIHYDKHSKLENEQTTPARKGA